MRPRGSLICERRCLACRMVTSWGSREECISKGGTGTSSQRWPELYAVSGRGSANPIGLTESKQLAPFRGVSEMTGSFNFPLLHI